MKKYAIALAFKGKLLEEFLNAWHILDKEMKINSISSHSPRPFVKYSHTFYNFSN
jgi:hypothetical protein